MTKDDAIAILQGVARYLMSGNEILYSDKLMIAIDMAIEALSTKDVPDKNVGDIISRQAAIDTLHMDTSIIPYKKAREYADATILEIRNRLEKLPSAQPEIVRCKGCKHWKNKHLCESLSRYGSFETKADFYCGYAERRTDG